MANFNKLSNNTYQLQNLDVNIGTSIPKMNCLTVNSSGNIELSSLLDLYYPVGSVYYTMNNTFDPNVEFGGKWERIKNRFIYGTGDKGSTPDPLVTGGEATHVLTTDEMPSHKHGTPDGAHFWTWGNKSCNLYQNSGQISSGKPSNNQLCSKQNIYNATLSVGGGEAHNNMPPYISCHIWYRTA